ncbi:unnamed protein product, partial [marine sediment metagenome]
MSEEYFTFEKRGPVALIGFNRATKRNAISDAVIDQLEVEGRIL